MVAKKEREIDEYVTHLYVHVNELVHCTLFSGMTVQHFLRSTNLSSLLLLKHKYEDASFNIHTQFDFIVQSQFSHFLKEIAENPVSMPSNDFADQAISLIAKAREHKDSIGGTVECIVTGLKPGIGETVFDKLDATLAYAVMGIGAVKAFEVGAGIQASKMYGSEYNDAFYMENGKVSKRTNHSGGTLGGMSDGSDLFIKAHFKPTPSIASPQSTITTQLEETTVEIMGRHDPVIVPRAVVVVESMVAIALADLILCDLGANLENIKRLYHQ